MINMEDNAVKPALDHNQQEMCETQPLYAVDENDHTQSDKDLNKSQALSREQDKEDWKIPIEPFVAAKHGKKHSSKTPKRIRKYYKQQDKLIEEFEVIYQSPQDEQDSRNESTKIDKDERRAELAAKITLFANLLLFCGKMVATVMSGSLSIMSSLVDSAVDLLSGIVMWCTAAAMKRRNSFKYPTGKKRMEPLAIMTLAIIMSMASAMVIMKSAEQIQEYATADGDKGKLGPKIDVVTIVLICITIATKLVLFLTMFRIKNATVKTLAQDHRNDVISNIVALIMGFVGSKYWAYADPVGAILIAFYILASWVVTAYVQVRLLVGRSATPDFQKKLTWICINHHPKIRHIDTVIAFHYGNNFIAEVHVVLPELMTVKEAHEIQESLQHKLETLSQVERAFVHIDYETSHTLEDEHKVV